jgi:uncharacterized membrane protein YhiD involved in acid resistance
VVGQLAFIIVCFSTYFLGRENSLLKKEQQTKKQKRINTTRKHANKQEDMLEDKKAKYKQESMQTDRKVYVQTDRKECRQTGKYPEEQESTVYRQTEKYTDNQESIQTIREVQYTKIRKYTNKQGCIH